MAHEEPTKMVDSAERIEVEPTKMVDSKVCYIYRKRFKTKQWKTICKKGEWQSAWAERRVEGYHTRVVMKQICFTSTPSKVTCPECIRILIEQLAKNLGGT